MQRADGFPILYRSFRLYLQVQGLRPRTIELYCREVDKLGLKFPARPAQSITSNDLRSYFESLTHSVSPKTVRECQIGLRRFFRFLAAEGEIDSDPMKEMKLMAFRVTPQPTYSEAEVKKLLMACNRSTPRGLRDVAMVLVLFDTGVREGELVSMTVPDWERRKVMVSGKTGVRAVPLGVATLQAVERYSRKWQITEGLLWRGLKGPMTESGVLQVIRRLCREAGVPQKGVHAFRRAAAAQMKRLGMNDSDILEVMGWRDVTMLRRYIAEVAEDLAFKAHDRFSPGDNLRLSPTRNKRKYA